MQAEHDQALSNLGSAKKQTISRIAYEIDSLSKTLNKLDTRISELRKQREELQRQQKQADADIESFATVLQIFSRGASSFSNYDQFMQSSDPGSAIIRRQCNDILSSIADAEKTYAKTPVYNFGKRNTLRKTIAEGKAQFAIAATRIVSDHINEAQNSQAQLRETANALNTQLTEITESIRTADKEARSLRARISVWRECSLLFASSEFPDTKIGLLPATYKECSTILSTYEEQRNSVNRFARRVNSFVQTKQDLLNEQQELANSGYSEEDDSPLSQNALTAPSNQAG